jgi:hypothetical protein
MDIAKLNTRRGAQTGAELQLLHFDSRELLPIFITLRGMESKEFRDQMLANARASRERLLAAQRLDRTAEEIQADQIALLVAVTVSWRDEDLGRPVIQEDHPEHGRRELECNAENARYLYAEYGWIREQADGFIARRANFLPRSGTG